MTTIFIFIPWFHPAYKAGGPIQSIDNMVKELSEVLTYKIYTSNRDLGGSIFPIETDKWLQYNGNTKVWYSSKSKVELSVSKKEINPTTDILFINGIYSWTFTLKPLLFFKTKRKIVSARGMLHPGALSQKPLKKNIYLTMWKLFRLHKNCDFHASTEEEKEYIKKIFGKKTKVFIASNFPRTFPVFSFPDKSPGTLNLVSIALVSPMKNHLIIIQSLVKCSGDITYNIYGPIKDQEYWHTCLREINQLPPNITINYFGDVPPHEVASALAKNHVFILPSKSENFGHAIYEALSAGKPVITSNHTPWNNLKESKSGINVDTNNIESLSDAINYFTAMGEKEFSEWSKGANRYAAKAIDLNMIKEQYRKMFFNC